jgi:hypothetical protein
VSELEGLVLLVAGLGALVATGALVACCLQLGSVLELVLAAYVVAWAWLVATVFALSPFELVTQGWFLAAIAVGLALAAVAWLRAGRPAAPAVRPGMEALRRALRRPVLAVLAVAVALGAAYTVALAFFTPVNEADALSYHVARAAFWRQENAVGYVTNAVDLRLNVSPPNAEIGQLATMLLAGNDRYVALPQLAAYGALVLCVTALARRLGLSVPEALFGALAFATLPVVVVQASGALNDLVVASFLAITVLFALSPGRAALALATLALGLALGTKFTAVLALPALVLVVALARPRRDWPGLALGGVAGAALGSTWYVVNLAESGELDGGLAAQADQRVALAGPELLINTMRYVLDLVDMSGLSSPYTLLLIPAALVGSLLALTASRQIPRGATIAGACLLTLSPLVLPLAARAGESVTTRTWAALDRPDTAPFEQGWGLNIAADSAYSWFGPLGLLLLLVGTIGVAVLWRRRQLPAWALGLAAAPWIILATLALTVVWDPWRGRFLVFGVALAAATWGILLRSPVSAGATAAIGTIALAMSLANYEGKPSGLWRVWEPNEEPFVDIDSVWGDSRPRVQARLRADGAEDAVFRHVDSDVPRAVNIAVAARENEYLSPYFGADLSRHVSLVADGGVVPPEAGWLVVSPSSVVRRCRDAWRQELSVEPGWSVERRLGPDACLP